MDASVQWNWVTLAYGFAYGGLVVFTISIGMRIARARRRLGGIT